MARLGTEILPQDHPYEKDLAEKQYLKESNDESGNVLSVRSIRLYDRHTALANSWCNGLPRSGRLNRKQGSQALKRDLKHQHNRHHHDHFHHEAKKLLLPVAPSLNVSLKPNYATFGSGWKTKRRSKAKCVNSIKADKSWSPPFSLAQLVAVCGPLEAKKSVKLEPVSKESNLTLKGKEKAEKNEEGGTNEDQSRDGYDIQGQNVDEKPGQAIKLLRKETETSEEREEEGKNKKNSKDAKSVCEEAAYDNKEREDGEKIHGGGGDDEHQGKKTKNGFSNDEDLREGAGEEITDVENDNFKFRRWLNPREGAGGLKFPVPPPFPKKQRKIAVSKLGMRTTDSIATFLKRRKVLQPHQADAVVIEKKIKGAAIDGLNLKSQSENKQSSKLGKPSDSNTSNNLQDYINSVCERKIHQMIFPSLSGSEPNPLSAPMCSFSNADFEELQSHLSLHFSKSDSKSTQNVGANCTLHNQDYSDTKSISLCNKSANNDSDEKENTGTQSTTPTSKMSAEQSSQFNNFKMFLNKLPLTGFLQDEESFADDSEGTSVDVLPFATKGKFKEYAGQLKPTPISAVTYSRQASPKAVSVDKVKLNNQKPQVSMNESGDRRQSPVTSTPNLRWHPNMPKSQKEKILIAEKTIAATRSAPQSPILKHKTMPAKPHGGKERQNTSNPNSDRPASTQTLFVASNTQPSQSRARSTSPTGKGIKKVNAAKAKVLKTAITHQNQAQSVFSTFKVQPLRTQVQISQASKLALERTPSMSSKSEQKQHQPLDGTPITKWKENKSVTTPSPRSVAPISGPRQWRQKTADRAANTTAKGSVERKNSLETKTISTQPSLLMPLGTQHTTPNQPRSKSTHLKQKESTSQEKTVKKLQSKATKPSINAKILQTRQSSKIAQDYSGVGEVSESAKAYEEPPSEAARLQKKAYAIYKKSGKIPKFPGNDIAMVKYEETHLASPWDSRSQTPVITSDQGVGDIHRVKTTGSVSIRYEYDYRGHRVQKRSATTPSIKLKKGRNASSKPLKKQRPAQKQASSGAAVTKTVSQRKPAMADGIKFLSKNVKKLDLKEKRHRKIRPVYSGRKRSPETKAAAKFVVDNIAGPVVCEINPYMKSITMNNENLRSEPETPDCLDSSTNVQGQVKESKEKMQTCGDQKTEVPNDERRPQKGTSSLGKLESCTSESLSPLRTSSTGQLVSSSRTKAGLLTQIANSRPRSRSNLKQCRNHRHHKGRKSHSRGRKYRSLSATSKTRTAFIKTTTASSSVGAKCKRTKRTHRATSDLVVNATDRERRRKKTLPRKKKRNKTSLVDFSKNNATLSDKPLQLGASPSRFGKDVWLCASSTDPSSWMENNQAIIATSYSQGCFNDRSAHFGAAWVQSRALRHRCRNNEGQLAGALTKVDQESQFLSDSVCEASRATSDASINPRPKTLPAAEQDNNFGSHSQVKRFTRIWSRYTGKENSLVDQLPNLKSEKDTINYTAKKTMDTRIGMKNVTINAGKNGDAYKTGGHCFETVRPTDHKKQLQTMQPEQPETDVHTSHQTKKNVSESATDRNKTSIFDLEGRLCGIHNWRFTKPRRRKTLAPTTNSRKRPAQMKKRNKKQHNTASFPENPSSRTKTRTRRKSSHTLSPVSSCLLSPPPTLTMSPDVFGSAAPSGRLVRPETPLTQVSLSCSSDYLDHTKPMTTNTKHENAEGDENVACKERNIASNLENPKALGDPSRGRHHQLSELFSSDANPRKLLSDHSSVHLSMRRGANPLKSNSARSSKPRQKEFVISSGKQRMGRMDGASFSQLFVPTKTRPNSPKTGTDERDFRNHCLRERCGFDHLPPTHPLQHHLHSSWRRAHGGNIGICRRWTQTTYFY